jgi:hypothetical protein
MDPGPYSVLSGFTILALRLRPVIEIAGPENAVEWSKSKPLTFTITEERKVRRQDELLKGS